MAWNDRLNTGSEDLDEALDRSLVLLQEGRTIEDCLARFPEQAEELRPLLEVAVQIWRVPAPDPSPTGFAAGKQRMLDALAQKEAAPAGLLARLRAWIGLGRDRVERGLPVPRLVGSAAAAVAVLVLVVVGALVVRSWRGTMVRQEAVLRPTDGLVEVLPSGAEEWLSVSQDLLVRDGDRIRTGAASLAELIFFDGSTTRLTAKTELTLARMASRRTGAGKVIVLHQWLGESRNQVQPLIHQESSFRVETASAVVSVQGTSFTLAVEPDGTTRVEVQEGTVEVRTPVDSATFGAGEKILIGPSEPIATTTTTPTPVAELEEPPSPSPEGEVPSSEPPWSLFMLHTPESIELGELDATEEITGTATFTPTPTPTATPTATPRPPTPTATPRPPAPTEEPAQPTEEPANTPQPPGQTKTPQPPGQTKTPRPARPTKAPGSDD